MSFRISAGTTLRDIAFGETDPHGFDRMISVHDHSFEYAARPDAWWRPPQNSARTIWSLGERIGVDDLDRFVLTWAGSVQELTERDFPASHAVEDQARRLWETASIVLYNDATVDNTSFTTVGHNEITAGYQNRPFRRWHFLLSATSFARAAFAMTKSAGGGLNADDRSFRFKPLIDGMARAVECQERLWHEDDIAIISAIAGDVGKLNSSPGAQVFGGGGSLGRAVFTAMPIIVTGAALASGLLA